LKSFFLLLKTKNKKIPAFAKTSAGKENKNMQSQLRTVQAIGPAIEYVELTRPAKRICRAFLMTALLIFLCTAVFLLIT